MNTEYALSFLREHQPLPPTKDIPEELLAEFDAIRKYFAQFPDERCVQLLLNAFGEGDGHGVYQQVEDTIALFPSDTVIAALKRALSRRDGSIRYWNAQIAANYPSAELIDPLLGVLREGSVDEQIAAVTALEGILLPYVRQALEAELSSNIEPEVKDLIRDVLGHV